MKDTDVIEHSSKRDHIVMLHFDSAQLLALHEILRETIGMQLSEIADTAKELCVKFKVKNKLNQEIKIMGEGLSLSEYLIFQRMFFEMDGLHLDIGDYSQLTGATNGASFISAWWDKNRITIGAGNGGTRTGVRICRRFYKKDNQ